MSLSGAGLAALQEYLALHVLTCLVPAFFLAGAIADLFPRERILGLLGAEASKKVSYTVAAVSGCILAVCSCTVLPLFAGIYRRGAGIGPATTFLFSAPAINILAVVYTAQILGFTLGAARAVVAVVMSVVIGLVMAAIFRNGRAGFATHSKSVSAGREAVLFILLVAMLVSGGVSYALYAGLGVLTAVYAVRSFTQDELSLWLKETWFLTRMIVPLLLIGVFFAGIITEVLPAELITRYLGGNSLRANAIASVSGALMYFATLTEVPIISALTRLGMGTGPTLTTLLAGPALSLPNMMVIMRIIGRARGAAYIALVIVISMLSGLVFGALT